jgi:hypothetical protein
VAHVELSLSEPLVPAPAQPAGPLDRWSRAVADAVEPCLVIDAMSEIQAVSPAACRLLGFANQAAVVGRHLFGGILRLLDFTAAPSVLADTELEKIPSVLAYSSQRLARGLMRVRSDGAVRTLDAIATPLFDGDKVVGSLTFFSQI